VQLFISIIAGIAVGLSWLAIWAYVLHAFGIALFQRKAEDRASRRERIKQMGKLRYILMFGVLGSGLAFGLALLTADFLSRDSFRWTFEVAKLLFLTVLFGGFQGARSWSETFRDPVAFPPNYPPAK
jgi:4-amino-4-deoxy-L-arabinose transferase-like glycosyltransferase